MIVRSLGRTKHSTDYPTHSFHRCVPASAVALVVVTDFAPSPNIVRPETCKRVLRWLPLVRVHGWPFRKLVLLGPLR